MMRKIEAFESFKFNDWPADKYVKLARVLFFCLVIGLPQISAFLGWNPAVKQEEKRQLASFPTLAWNARSWISFPKSYESFFLDRFNMRSWLIRVHSRLKYFVLHVSPLEQVTLGQNGWLFYSSAKDGDPLSCYRGTNLFSDKRLALMIRNLETWKKWFEKQGISYFILIAPDKYSMYPENLPPWMRRVAPRTRLEQFMESVPPDIAEIMVCPEDALLEAKKRFPTYFKTDTHWNQWGAFIAAQSLMDTVSGAMPGRAPRQVSDYEITAGDRAGGDLAVMLGIADLLDDTEVKVTPKASPSKPQDPSIAQDDGPSAPAGRQDRPKVLIFGDSFSYGILPFIDKDLYTIKHVYSTVMKQDVILREKPDIVIQELVERYLDRLGNNAPKAD